MTASVVVHDFKPIQANLLDEVIQGLSQPQKRLHPKLLYYDITGAELFEQICQLPEYYPTRTELGLLQQHAAEIAAVTGTCGVWLEPGSGNSQKFRLLTTAVQPKAYVPMDISHDFLFLEAELFAKEYPAIAVHAVCLDYSVAMTVPEALPEGKRIAFFPGSSIGNFERSAAIQFLQQVYQAVQPKGGLLIGVDLKKDLTVLQAAYDDQQGVTAAFNLNVLQRINSELAADFNLANFQHCARYNTEFGRIEMHLQSRCQQQVKVAGQVFHFQPGETIHTENSHKYEVAEFQAMAVAAGFKPVQVWLDQRQWFSLHYFE